MKHTEDGGVKCMINMNLKRLRQLHQYTQEELAEKLGVSRQVVAKWEKGDSTPDLHFCIKLAELYDVTIDNLVNYDEREAGVSVPPKGKYFFGATTVGERGQMVIPKKARELFHIETGDTLIVVGDDERGLAIVPQNYMQRFFPPNVLLDKKDENE
jgi:AbrB family looped-hinge helix DNA binding protein